MVEWMQHADESNYANRCLHYSMFIDNFEKDSFNYLFTHLCIQICLLPFARRDDVKPITNLCHSNVL